MAGRLRITSGNLRGRLIDVPSAADDGLLRPTPDRVREAVFSSLGESVKNARVLDVFAGSGIQAFECLSRGASTATLVEINPKSAAVIKKNAASLGIQNNLKLIIGDAFKEVQRLEKEAYDLAFVDPPYPVPLTTDFWAQLQERLCDDAIVVYRCEKLNDFVCPVGYEVIRERQYGGTAAFFLRKTP